MILLLRAQAGGADSSAVCCVLAVSFDHVKTAFVLSEDLSGGPSREAMLWELVSLTVIARVSGTWRAIEWTGGVVGLQEPFGMLDLKQSRLNVENEEHSPSRRCEHGGTYRCIVA